MKSFIALAGMLCVFSSHASELISNLRSRIQDLPSDRGALIKSYSEHTQSYIYDQALAVIAFTRSGEIHTARKLLRGLESLQMKDGSLYFSYNMDGTSIYPQEGDKRIAGAISWVALAAVQYQNKFNSKEFYRFNYKILSYLDSEIVPVGKDHKALRFSPTRDIAALEHNLDAYSAFLHFSEINKTDKWKDEITQMRSFILGMWDKNRKHFWSGANTTTGVINKSEMYLDNQSWTLLALDSKDLNEISPEDALELNCEVFHVKDNGVEGFMDSKPTRSPASDKFVWSEGTLGQILAMQRVQKNSCNETSVSVFLENVKKMQKVDGGIAYATETTNKDFTTDSSVAGTAWMYFAVNGINPFQIN